jgi:membrane-bound lytic murein transglycosylase D
VDRIVFPKILWSFLLWIVFVIACPSPSFSLTPPEAKGPKSPPIPELIPSATVKQNSDPSFSSSELDSLPQDEEENCDVVANDLPPIIKPSREEIKEKVILELKELEKSGDPKIQASFDIPIVINDQVEYFIDYFQTKLRNRFSLWMARSTRYIPLMKKILSEFSLPEDLVYLAMIESGFSTKAYSRAHAAGPWQFIRETGERYGLRVNSWIDERKDPIKSTRAAAKHLADLYNRFGSWYLAAAGYNAGEGKISRALALYNAQDYWEITGDNCRYIKDETKQYVPKMIAAALIAKEPEKYGFVGIHYYSPLSFDEVTVPGNVELKDVAVACGVDLETIVDLNPELKRWITPPGSSSYALHIPVGTKDKLMDNYAQLIKPKPVVTYAEHRVKKGERLASIARRYKVKASLIARVNRIKGKGGLHAGLVLLIPRKGNLQGTSSDIESSDQEKLVEKSVVKRASRNTGKKKILANHDGNEKEDVSHRIRYKVKKGDSLFSIAERFDVEISMIKKWNPKGSKKIQAGSTLTLFIEKGNSEREGKKENGRPGKLNHKKFKAEGERKIKLVIYTVKRGDSLSEIAQKFNTTPDQIQTWNHFSAKRLIKPGDKLTLKLINPQKFKAEGEGRIKLVIYTVKRGDSLSEIAQKFNTTPDQIRTWNRQAAKSPIKPGDKLSLKLINRPSEENI